MPSLPSSYQDDPVRRRLYRKLGFTEFLAKREILKVGSIPIHCELYLASPSAPVILFLPGIGTYVELYCELLCKLCQQGFNVVAIDLRGHGYSGGERGLYKVEDIISDCSEVIDQLQSRFTGPIGIFGCSMGARLALSVTESESRIQSLLCHTLFLAERPPDFWHMLGWQYLSMSSWFMPDFKVDFRSFVDIDALLADNPMAEMADEDELLVWDYPVSTLNSVFSYPSKILRQPLVASSAILVGSEDEVLRPSYIKRLINDSKQPFTYLEVNHGRHMLPFDHIDDTLSAATTWFHNTLK